MDSESRSPSPKRIRLDSGSPEPVEKEKPAEEVPEDLDEDHCSICLQAHIDRTVIPTCSHEFCFDCLMIWAEQSRRCPLCSQTIGDHVIHNIRSRYDYQKRYLTPLRSSPPMLPLRSRPPVTARNRRRIPREVRERSRREREKREEADRFDRAVAKRKWVYKHGLYAKHIASNGYTRYRPYPIPAQFAASQELISRTTSFLRRELLVWPNLDIEFLTTFIISLMKAIDIRSESAVKLLAEFLDMDTPYVEGRRHVNAEHFAHEVYSYVRSPYRDLFTYDDVVQYENPREASPPLQDRAHRRNERWRQSSSSSSHSRSSPRRRRSTSRLRDRGRRRSRSKSRSPSWSPSGRRYSREPGPEPEIGRNSRGKRGRRSRSRDRDNYDVEGRERGPRLSNRPSQRGSSMERYSFGHNESDNIRGSPNDQPHANEGKGKERAQNDDDADSYGRQQSHSETSGLAESVSHNIERPDSMKANGIGGSSSSVDRQVEADHYGRGFSDMGGHSENFIKPDEMSNGMVTGILDAIDCKVHIDSTSEGNTRGPRSAPKMRNRNLLQSVQAHLASNSRVRSDEQGERSRSVTSLPQNASTPPSALTSSDVPAEKPSLLSRLSDVYTGVGNPKQAGIHIANPTPGQAPTKIIDLEKELMETDDEKLKSRPQSTLSPAVLTSMVAIDTSTPSKLDVGTFGHGRLPQPREALHNARQPPKDTRASSPPKSPFFGQASTATGNDNKASFAGLDTVGENTTPDISLGYSNSLVTDLTDAGMPDSRMKLLQRLEEEKKRVQKGHDGSRDSNGAQVDASPTAVHDTPSDDSKAMEAKLRMRAHLRVRLASEKRSCVGSDSPNT
ncbi:ring finger domain protein [Moniliophthora roreri MCA 2997]|uniref:RING-type E3 ubiquitin transferase n=1 Tax=Moniliophthora roreri (strain MCA 2997) TaxID=1381753 RepID=V2X436_MONRO|nr:ring finger domain protein [Moniliophthora roreri MCA 2997]